MSTKTKAYIAGAGLSPSKGKSSSSSTSAAVKALLDAGVTYDNVSKTIVSKDISEARDLSKKFNDDGVSIDSVANGEVLSKAVEAAGGRKTECMLAVARGKDEVVAFVLVSEDFLMRWPYLKDSSMLVENAGKSSEGSLSQTCRKVWELRGWGKAKGSSSGDGSDAPKLKRADGQSAPKWKDVEYKQDGKHRLGYNPVEETREVSQEDFEAVQAIGKGKRDDTGTSFEKKGGDRATLKKQHKHMAKL